MSTTDLTKNLSTDPPTRRDFLVKALALGGSGMLLATMKAWGMDLASRKSVV